MDCTKNTQMHLAALSITEHECFCAMCRRAFCSGAAMRKKKREKHNLCDILTFDLHVPLPPPPSSSRMSPWLLRPPSPPPMPRLTRSRSSSFASLASAPDPAWQRASSATRQRWEGRVSSNATTKENKRKKSEVRKV